MLAADRWDSRCSARQPRYGAYQRRASNRSATPPRRSGFERSPVSSTVSPSQEPVGRICTVAAALSHRGRAGTFSRPMPRDSSRGVARSRGCPIAWCTERPVPCGESNQATLSSYGCPAWLVRVRHVPLTGRVGRQARRSTGSLGHRLAGHSSPSDAHERSTGCRASREGRSLAGDAVSTERVVDAGGGRGGARVLPPTTVGTVVRRATHARPVPTAPSRTASIAASFSPGKGHGLQCQAPYQRPEGYAHSLSASLITPQSNFGSVPAQNAHAERHRLAVGVAPVSTKPGQLHKFGRATNAPQSGR